MKEEKLSPWKRIPKWLRRGIIVLLCVALLGGAVYGVLLLARGSGGEVNVFPVMDFVTGYADDRAETQGMVTTDKLQSVYISSTQKVTRIFVREGESVRAGDPILSFDTTLTDLELERKGIEVQQLQLALAEAERERVRVNSYRAYVPGRTTVTPTESGPLITVSVPFLRVGNGTRESPYVFMWDESCTFTDGFVSSILPPLPEGFDAETDDLPTVYAVFEIRESNSPDGAILLNWNMVFQRGVSGDYTFVIREASGNYDGSMYEDIELPEMNAYPGQAYSMTELISMRQEAQNKVTQLELDLKKAELEYETLQFELSNGMVYSNIDGVVKTIRDPDEAAETAMPVVMISGGGGYYATGALSEVELENIHVGDTVTVMSWQTYSESEATIVSISEYPVGQGSGYYHWSQGNNNSSLYPFTVYLDEDTPVREGEWVNITYNPFGESASGMFLQNMFIRQEGGRSFVFVRGEEGRLEKREVVTGRSLWGSFTQILGGLTEEDYIAFPFGRSFREGVRTSISGSEVLYSY